MAAQPTVFIGIEPGTAHKTCAMMVLDAEQHIQAQGCGDLADALSFAAGVGSAVVAVNAPAKLSDARGGRAIEKELLAQGAWIYQTPATLKACPAALRRGLELHKYLAEMGYVPGPTEEAPRQKIEAPADAAFWSLLGLRPFDPTTLEGRLQRQLALADAGLPVPDAMDFFEEITRHKLLHGMLPLKNIFSAEELNALMCAHIAWRCVCQPESLRWLGQPDEGSVAIPLAVQKQNPQS